MKINIVLRSQGKDLAQSGKYFEVQIPSIPRLNEVILFDYIEDDNSLAELYEVLQLTKSDQFRVTEIYHNCNINKLPDTAALLFLEAVH